GPHLPRTAIDLLLVYFLSELAGHIEWTTIQTLQYVRHAGSHIQDWRDPGRRRRHWVPMVTCAPALQEPQPGFGSIHGPHSTERCLVHQFLRNPASIHDSRSNSLVVHRHSSGRLGSTTSAAGSAPSRNDHPGSFIGGRHLVPGYGQGE